MGRYYSELTGLKHVLLEEFLKREAVHDSAEHAHLDGRALDYMETERLGVEPMPLDD